MVIHKPDHLAYVLKVNLKEIISIIDDRNVDSFYTEIRKQKTKGVRIINPSHRRLKVIQKRIQQNILNNLKLPDYSYGAVKGRDNVDNVKNHRGKKYKFTTDLRSFFPSVTNTHVFQRFRRYGFSPDVSHILTKLTTYKGRLPQGAPTSSSVANLVFVKTGDNLAAFAKRHQITFTSFVDDLAFSSPVDFKDKVEELIDMITIDGFRISHEKTNYSRNPLITGLHPMNNHLRLSDKFVKKLSNINNANPHQQQGMKLYKDKVEKANKKSNITRNKEK